jgi:hypothetical protein
MKKSIWYAARNSCENLFEKWSNLIHIKEVLSLDGMLSEPAFEPERQSNEYWEFSISDGIYSTNFYSSLAYVLEKTEGKDPFNLFAIIYEPGKTKSNELNSEFEFVGYELLDKPGFEISVLTNRWPLFDEIHKGDLNTKGLLSDYKIAKIVQQNLKKNHPEESHADCGLFEVWRHKTIGRK